MTVIFLKSLLLAVRAEPFNVIENFKDQIHQPEIEAEVDNSTSERVM